MAKTICLLNFKGGVGKTTVAINLAAALNRRNRVGDETQHNRVLVIDMDVQCTATSVYKTKDNVPKQRTIYEILTEMDEDKNYVGLTTYKSVTEGIHFVPSSPKMRYIETDMERNAEKTHVMAEVLDDEDLQDYFDYIIMDCPPNEGVVSKNGMIAADYILIPIMCEKFSVQGLVNIMSEVKMIQKRSNPKLKVLGIVCNRIEMTTDRKSGDTMPKKVKEREILEDLNEYYSDLMLKTYIRDNKAVKEFSITSQDVFEYAPDSQGAKDFESLAAEIETRINND